jgi:ribonucleoside-diphosphate reductase alpha chain
MAGILGRRISVGNTGLADCLAALGLRYDSDEGIEMAEKIYEFMANAAYKASAILAYEKGAFPAFDLEKTLKSPFIQRLQPETIELIKKYGLRNIGLLTQAPAGSMSILFRNCSSGIEPVFMLNYTRNVKKPGTKDFEQHVINHQAVEDCFQAGGDPDVFVPAGSIDYSKRIQMQSRIQRHIDHSISSTINLPNSVTVEEVSKIYMEAYDAGLKGITVYRDGCRTGVLVSSEKKPAAHRAGQVIERPKTTDVDIHKTRYKDKSYMILVGKVENGHPIEIFGGLEDGLSLPTVYKSATLTKKSRGHYSLTVQLSDDEEDILKVNNVGNRFPAQDIMTLTRMISLSLRNGISVGDIVEQLNKATTALYDAPAVFARVLKQYISDEDAINKEKAKGKVCPECGAALEYKRESGCVVELCSSCTYTNSKCG